MQTLVLLTPDEENTDLWRVRVFPWPAPFAVPGLSESGEAVGLPRSDFGELDERMMAVRAGYHKRLHPSGVMEVSTTGRGVEALCTWVAELVKTR